LLETGLPRRKGFGFSLGGGPVPAILGEDGEHMRKREILFGMLGLLVALGFIASLVSCSEHGEKGRDKVAEMQMDKEQASSAEEVSSNEHREKGKDKVAETQMDKKRLSRAEEALAKNESKLMSIPGVVGVGVGLTEKGDRPAIHVYFNVKTTGGTIPPSIPKQIDNVPVRVIETDEIKAL
jgi:gas vesicle protein